MLAKTGLLVVSNPTQIGKILPSIQKRVKNTLYIQLLSALSEPFGNFYTNVFTSWPKYSKTLYGIYSQAATHCENLDVRVLLSGLKYQTVSQIQTKSNIDLIIFDRIHSKTDIDNFIKTKVANIASEYNVVTLDSAGDRIEDFICDDDESIYNHTVLGGTFDRLHTAHKLLLTEAALRSRRKVTVGVTEESMLPGKILWELIENLDVRIQNVENFLNDICAELDYNVVPISDPFGPSITDPTMEMIVVSEETVKGSQKINEIRLEKQLNPLDVHSVKLIDEPYPNLNEERKISSSTGRIRLLGTLLRPVAKKNIPNKPYVIGLTGGVASGKSGVANWLIQHEAEIINCDLIGHEVYKSGRPCHTKIVDCFGDSVLTPEGEVDRKVLGSIVFSDSSALKKLNGLVWPAIADEVQKMITNSKNPVVVVEAAVLLTAGWQSFCHEVWSTLVPRSEAIKRLMARNKLTEEQAIARINSQPSNKAYVQEAHVVLCPLWDVEFTGMQVKKAWDLLQDRLL
ncbi:bifunctional coenzyme A synthase [Tribolium castaneum]|uniref:Bifunctional coenzyme A synthase n=1 Tax=Tribolium castaneum TaxID=7070 RepID=D6WVB0_TRICA|nr:PREDICTED: bifunctional coenzyme A synthase [Tribolium castaneum]EFA07751.2 Bifunctional coenzyme A synthase-like Protein [Tribolium castaneum]|eukprot:XP_975172.1 PREDICTED: bifunctional coenzyme A synthase [Tribolium castaneum]